MADSVDIKPKLTGAQIEDMLAQKELLKQETPTVMYKSSGNPGSMKRPTKLFIKVDREGLLTDTIAISDVVNFDCYESIVSSACRIIASFQSSKPENIEVESLFYYKKRARSTRMNPVLISSTTDAFKAVAEHPVGEVPLGVRWTQNFRRKRGINQESLKSAVQNEGKKHFPEGRPTSANPNPVAAEPLSGKRSNQGRHALKKRTIPVAVKKELHAFEKERPDNTEINVMVPDQSTSAATVRSTEENGVREKRLKLVENIQRSQQEVRVQMQNATTDISPFNQAFPVVSWEAFKGNQTVLPHSNSRAVPSQGMKADEEELSEVPNSTPDTLNSKYIPRQGPDSSYMFPEGAKAEFVITYGDGVVEKKRVPEEVVKVVNNMLRGNYSYLTKEAQMILSVGPSAGQPVDKDEEKDSFNTRMTSSGIPEFENKKPIKYIKDAKSEIFRTLSMLSVSKTRFKSLLKWMKTLKLEGGKKGKFVLSARDVIGGTKYVISSNFETDEDNMLRQEQSYKPYGSSTHSKGPNEGDTTVKLPMPSIPEPPHNQIMFLMPTSISSIPNSATPVFKTAAGVTMVPTSKGPVPIQPMQMPVPSSQITTRSQSSLLNVSDSNAESVSGQTNTPPILRRHPRKPTHPSRSRDASPNPIPMNLYRSIQAPEEDRLSPLDKSSTESEGYITVKTEPHDYDSETCEANLDFDRNLETGVVSPRPCIHVLTHENSADPDRYDKDKVLKSDAAMPQSIEQDRPFDIVIKSEPLDVI